MKRFPGISLIRSERFRRALMIWSALGLVGLGVLLLIAPRSAHGAEPIKVSTTASHWTTIGGVEFAPHNGFDSIELKAGNYAQHVPSGQAVLSDLTFRNGTIEFDVEPTASMGGGIGFRRRDKDNYEDFYLRSQPKCEEAVDCVQYAPQTHGVLLWDVFPQYQSPAPLKLGTWNHVKLVVSGQRMNIFINGGPSPALKVGRLEGDTQEGGIVLQGPGFFANLTVTPDLVAGLSAEPEKDATADDLRFVRTWKLSPFSTLATDKDPTLADLPAASAAWQPLAAERAGLVNISRIYGLPLTRPERAVAWLKTTIHSEKVQTKKVEFGWVREAWVFVNGKPVYANKNLYQPPAARKQPDGRCALENGSFLMPLREGDNDVVIAVANNFYGWGILFRLDDVEGVRTAGL